MHASPNQSVLASDNFGASIGQVIHDWTPHNSLAIYGCSIVIFVGATIWASYKKRARANRRKMTGADLLRVGFAAGPIPIYLLLPLVPFDHDLTTVLMDEPFQLLIAAGIGLVWTAADIKKIVGR